MTPEEREEWAGEGRCPECGNDYPTHADGCRVKRKLRLSRDDLLTELLVELSCRQWHDVSDVCPDPTAVQCLATGWNGKTRGSTIFFLTRYEDDDAEFALVSHVESRDGDNDGKSVTQEQFKLQWLWEHAIERIVPPEGEP